MLEVLVLIAVAASIASLVVSVRTHQAMKNQDNIVSGIGIKGGGPGVPK
jgi:hypothetical protein